MFLYFPIFMYDFPIHIFLQCGAPKIAKLVYNSNVTMVYHTYNYSIHGVYKPTYTWGAPHCMYIYIYGSVSKPCTPSVHIKIAGIYGCE